MELFLNGSVSVTALLRNDERFEQSHLVIAGGYDERVTENREHYEELRSLQSHLKLNSVTFLRSFDNSMKIRLLQRSTCLLYTPDKEHFGIVPVEAMYKGCPVVAVNSGGPVETVKDGQTGYLCDQTAESFAEAMSKFLDDPSLRSEMGAAGKSHVRSNFSFEAMKVKLNAVISQM